MKRVTNLVDVPVDLSAGGILAPGASVMVSGMDDAHDAWLVTAGIVDVGEVAKPKSGKVERTEDKE